MPGLIEEEIVTFTDLYKFVVSPGFADKYDDDLKKWLLDPDDKWVGKDKQESALRLFAGLGYIDKLKSFDMCHGNYNKKTITKNTTHKDVFINEGKHIQLKDKGDSSDLTGIHKSNDKHILVTTSKNLNTIQVGKLDIDKILTHFEQYKVEGYTMSLCICVRSRTDFEDMIRRIEETNNTLKSLLEKDTTIIIDWNDLNQAYHQFRMSKHIHIDDIMKSNKAPLCLKMHQRLGVCETLRLKGNGNNQMLWGHVPRSGKSYIIAGCIVEDSKMKEKCNYLVITTAINETKEQYIDVFNHLQFHEFHVQVLNSSSNNEETVKKYVKANNKNIIIVSDHYIKNTSGKKTEIEAEAEVETEDKTEEDKIKIKKIRWLRNLDFTYVFLDESHNGGTTKLAKAMMEYYGPNATQIFITATYSKPAHEYFIPKENIILWDLEDIKLCKNITNTNSIPLLVEKHGSCIQELISEYSFDTLIAEYSKYPELWVLTHEIRPEIVEKIIEATRNNHYGWSTDACFLLEQGIENNKKVVIARFQNERENLKLWYRIFGKWNEFGIPDPDYPVTKVFMKRIENISQNPTTGSRYIGSGEFHNEPMIIMAFLPQNNIYEISKATENLLTTHKVIPDYLIVSINNKTTTNPKQTIENARIKARNSGKKGVLVLSGKQCSLGVSIENCDIVLLLNNSTKFDMIYQMMFRSMTEGKNKRCGFVVDLNIHRAIETTMNYSSLIRPNTHVVDAIINIMKERIMNLNGDHWMGSFGTNEDSKLERLCKKACTIHLSSIDNVSLQLKRHLDSSSPLTTEQQKIVSGFQTAKTIKNRLASNTEGADGDGENIKKGIENIENENISKEENKKESENKEEKGNQEEKEKLNYKDVILHMIVLVCILTIHDNKSMLFMDMFDTIEKNEKLYTVFNEQVRSWWGKSISPSIIKRFIYTVCIDKMKDNKAIDDMIKKMKELFIDCKNDPKRLSQQIDKYLIPQELEKKSHAEVSTPFKLRQDMLDKIPCEFWTSVHKVFEPCAGKGGFILDIVTRFMIGLKETIPDEEERRKVVIEECLYFSDINPTNIFICKLLIDPDEKYNLNYNEGDTLKLDIKEKWGLDGFDAVIGNPPYQNSSGNKGSGNTLWDLFVKTSLKSWLITNGLLVFVHPQGWRQLNNKTGSLILSKQLLYLNMNDVKEGIKVFNCSTTFDYYVLQNCSVYKKTKIIDYKNIEIEYDLKDKKYIPNHSIHVVDTYLDFQHEHGLIKDRSNYGTEKKHMSKTKSNEYKFPCIYSINSKNELSLRWSKMNNNGHFHVTKYILSNGNGHYKDLEGTYGCTEWSYYINCSREDMNDIHNCLQNTEFLNIIDAVKLTSNKYNYVILKHLKDQFWKEFI